ncbi:hypothetical protein A4X09_0g4057 [Tilletia walkeri]|uniref:Bud22 domain-containing protein n=1 Tax=Tilletia walkeri TaxID=117179 RepID=A0A8X7N8H3_9BASI|nr:hypothetical protein A4X09_0g4057 [Tilletia walkeri]
MPKRKRTEAAESSGPDGGKEADGALEGGTAGAGNEVEPAPVDIKKLASKLHHHVRVLRATAKRARTFETQRTVKRLKAAKADEERNELEAELAAFKAVDIGGTAARALLMKCAKMRLLPKGQARKEAMDEDDEDGFPLVAALRSEGSLLPTWTSLHENKTSEGSATPQGKAAEKVQARLASSKMMAEEVTRVVQELQQIIDPSKKVQAPATSKAAEKEKATSNGAQSTKSKAEASQKATTKESKTDEPVKAKARKEASISKGPAPQSSQATKDDVEDTMDDAEDQDLDVGESGDDDFFEGGGQLDDEDGEDDEDINSDVYDNEGDGEGASDDDDGDDPHNLPTLSSGFVSHGLSLRDRGSDSEFSGGSDDEDDIDENAAETAAVGADGKKKSAGKSKKEKNRPGQRARQALWEKKYGRNARHIAILKKEPRSARPEEQRDHHRGGGRNDRGGRGGAGHARGVALSGTAALKRDEGWGSSRGQALAPQPQTSGPVRRLPASTSSSFAAARPSERTAPAPTRSAPTAAATIPHPSWVAKQKQKEQMSQALSLKPAGKKIVFG